MKLSRIALISFSCVAFVAGNSVAEGDSRRIDDLLEDPRIPAAFADVEAKREHYNDLLVELTEVPAPPFEEGARAEALVKKIEELGLDDVEIDEVGNVVARRPGATGERTIAIIAHIDTVFPAWTEIEVRREGDEFFAPGIGDNTRGVVAMLALIQVLEDHDFQTEHDILFVGSVGEEGLGDLRGVRHLFGPEGENIDVSIAIDGSAVERVVVGAVGSNRYRVTFSGPGGHSYGAFGRAHPHQALAKAITLFTERALSVTESGPKTTFSVGRIGGGTSINSIPFNSWMEVDMRSINPEKLSRLDEIFRAAMVDAVKFENSNRRSDRPLEVEIKSVGRRPAGQVDRIDPLVTSAAAAIRGLGFEIQYRESSTDSNIPMSLGIPAITIGAGGEGRNAHAPNESWVDQDAHLGIQLALLLTLEMAEYHSP